MCLLRFTHQCETEFELHRPSNKGTKLLLKVIKAIIIIIITTQARFPYTVSYPGSISSPDRRTRVMMLNLDG